MGRVLQLLNRFCLVCWLLAPYLGLGQQNQNNVLNNSYTALGLTVPGRTFYVSLTGNANSAKIGDPNKPFPPDFRQTGFIYTNSRPGDVITLLPGHYLVTNIFLNQGVTFQGAQGPQGTDVWLTTSTNCATGPGTGGCAFGLSTFQPLDNCTIQNIFWESTNIWVTNSTVSTGIFNSFLMGGYYYPTNVLIVGCKLFGGSDVFYGNAFGTPAATIRDSWIASFWDLAKFTPGMLYSYNNTWVNYSWLNIANPGVNGTIGINMFDTGSKFYGFNSGEIIGLKRMSGSEFYWGTNALNALNAFTAKWPNSAPSAGYYYDDFLKATVNIGADGGTYLTNSLSTNTTTLYGTNVMYITGATTVPGVNRGYTNQSLVTSNGISGPGSTFLVLGQGFWTNDFYTLTFNDPATTNQLESVLGPVDISQGVWAIKTNSNGGIVYALANGNSAFQNPNVFQMFLLGFSGSLPAEPFINQQTNSIVTNITPQLYPAIFGGGQAYQSNFNRSISTFCIASNSGIAATPLTNDCSFWFSNASHFYMIGNSNGTFRTNFLW